MIAQCQELLRKQLDCEKDDPDSFIDAAQNARLMASAERYFMFYGDLPKSPSQPSLPPSSVLSTSKSLNPFKLVEAGD